MRNHIDKYIRGAGGAMKLKEDAVRDELQNIELRQFFRLLELWVDGVPYDPFKMLDRFQKKGLQITAVAKEYIGDGCKILDDIGIALIRVRREYERNKGHDGFDADAPWKSVMVNINADKKPKKPRGKLGISDLSHEEAVKKAGKERISYVYKLPIGKLWVNEGDVKRICTELGLSHYYWPVVPWPDSKEDIEERPTKSHDKSDNLHRRQIKGVPISPRREPIDIAKPDEVGLSVDAAVDKYLSKPKRGSRFRAIRHAVKLFYEREGKIPASYEVREELIENCPKSCGLEVNHRYQTG